MRRSRREFLAEVGRGMLVASLGASLAIESGLSPVLAEEPSQRLTFDKLEPLVSLLQETPPDKLLPLVVERLRDGLELKSLTAAAALANARAFGGEHYGGFHTFMALVPAYQMAAELPRDRQALPILKVLYRNSAFLQESSAAQHDTLTPLASDDATLTAKAEQIQAAIDAGDKQLAERQLQAILRAGTPLEALQAALRGVEDNHDVHTVVLPWRAYAMLELTGPEHALTMLRQSVRKCAQQAVPNNDARAKELTRRRALVPKLLETHKLLAPRTTPTRNADDAWIEKFSTMLLSATDEQAAEAAAIALAEGFDPQQIGEAISLASNALILRQAETSPNYGQRTHGDSMGVHASDATNAWRNMLRVCDARQQAAGLMLAAANVASSARWGSSQQPPALLDAPYPHAEQLAAIKQQDAAALLEALDSAIRHREQLTACALVTRYGMLGHAERPAFDVLLKYAISEDGRLHSEKYYRTVTEEFATTRPAFRWRQLAALARVTASSYGLDAKDRPSGRAPGYEEACRLLKIG